MAKELTTIAIEKLKAGEKRREVPDGRVGGLYHIIQPSGKRSWATQKCLHNLKEFYTHLKEFYYTLPLVYVYVKHIVDSPLLICPGAPILLSTSI
jgi:hypothetical protein